MHLTHRNPRQILSFLALDVGWSKKHLSNEGEKNVALFGSGIWIQKSRHLDADLDPVRCQSKGGTDPRPWPNSNPDRNSGFGFGCDSVSIRSQPQADQTRSLVKTRIQNQIRIQKSRNLDSEMDPNLESVWIPFLFKAARSVSRGLDSDSESVWIRSQREAHPVRLQQAATPVTLQASPRQASIRSNTHAPSCNTTTLTKTRHYHAAEASSAAADDATESCAIGGAASTSAAGGAPSCATASGNTGAGSIDLTWQFTRTSAIWRPRDRAR